MALQLDDKQVEVLFLNLLKLIGTLELENERQKLLIKEYRKEIKQLKNAMNAD